MSILINRNSRILCQGITGKQGSFHTQKALEYGTNIVAGVTPNKGGQMCCGVPVFNTVIEAKKHTNCNVSVIYVPPLFAADAILEAILAEIELIICITEGIPVHDMILVKQYLKNSKSKLIGPNCPGVITIDEARVGIMPTDISIKGNIGIMSRSGTLTYEAMGQLTKLGLGQSTCLGIGGDSIRGLGFKDILIQFLNDDDTDHIVMIGEIGGVEEEQVSDFLLDNPTIKKTIFAFIAGQSAPKGKTMGHAGAIINSETGTAEYKKEKLRQAGVIIIDSLDKIGEVVKKYIS